MKDDAGKLDITLNSSLGEHDFTSLPYPESSDIAGWRHVLTRWLATLNPGRTPHEYEKAIRYFFQTPGVPQELAELTTDLLLAYRGALALRATPPARRSRRPQSAQSPHSARQLNAADRKALPGNGGYTLPDEGDNAQPSQPTPLAPATANLRLTALRQFLIYCHLRGSLAHLTPDQIRLALRRLTITRRRPYQILGEQEWEAFLAAALAPAPIPAPMKTAQHDSQEAVDKIAVPSEQRAIPKERSPWGIPRAQRQHAGQAPLTAVETVQSQPKRIQQAHDQDQQTPHEPSDDIAQPQPGKERKQLPHSRAGLTGEHTAQRDYALIALALATGLRAVELSLLDLGDLSREHHKGREEWWLVLPDAKTKGQRGGRTLPLAPTLVETLLSYIRATGRSWSDTHDRATPLFLSNMTHQRLTPTHIRRIVDRIETQWLAQRRQQSNDGRVDESGETRAISPHALRHSTAVALLEGNITTGRPPASVEHVRGWLGHFDIRTTQGYLAHLDSRRHRRAFALAPDAHPPTAPTVPERKEQEDTGGEESGL